MAIIQVKDGGDLEQGDSNGGGEKKSYFGGRAHRCYDVLDGGYKRKER
jgi:hypothetical protein